MTPSKYLAAIRPRNDVTFALGLTLTLRILYSVAAATMAHSVPIDPTLAQSNQLTEELAAPSPGLAAAFVRPWERFDTLWYLLNRASDSSSRDSVCRGQ